MAEKGQKWVQGFGVLEILDWFSIGFFMCLIFVGCMWIWSADMEFFFRDLSEESMPSQLDMLRCPFLRNINEPTNFNFSSSMAFPMPVRGAKGPIFEDAPHFDQAFRLFHGQDGVVPLSERSFVHSENVGPKPASSQFNPLAAKAATISLSSFGPGGPFGFDSFSEKWKNQKRKSNSSKKESSPQGGTSKHEAMGNEWLQSGNCPIAKSYRAVSNVLPLVASAFQLPPGMKYKCPPAIVAARAALARTAFAKNLRPQPLPAKVLVIGLMGMAANVPLGIWREHTEKFSPAWFAAVHAAVPFIAMLRKSVLMPKTAMAFTIAASILGQVIGSRAERHRMKTTAAKNSSLIEPADGSIQRQAVISHGGHCGDIVNWNPVSLKASGPSSTDVFCQ
ncbi:Serine/arginine repetitive matrix protein [Fagus crenata]